MHGGEHERGVEQLLEEGGGAYVGEVASGDGTSGGDGGAVEEALTTEEDPSFPTATKKRRDNNEHFPCAGQRSDTPLKQFWPTQHAQSAIRT